MGRPRIHHIDPDVLLAAVYVKCDQHAAAVKSRLDAAAAAYAAAPGDEYFAGMHYRDAQRALARLEEDGTPYDLHAFLGRRLTGSELTLYRKALRDLNDRGLIYLACGSGGRTTGFSTADVAATMVLQNNVIVGSVNANKRHWYKAGQALARADAAWLARLLSRRERPESFMNALHRQPEDIKVVIQFADV